MARPSMTIPDAVLDELDDQIWDLQRAEVLPRGNLRSKIVTAILADWNEEDTEAWLREQHPELLADGAREGNKKGPTVAAD